MPPTKKTPPEKTAVSRGLLVRREQSAFWNAMLAVLAPKLKSKDVVQRTAAKKTEKEIRTKLRELEKAA